MNHPFDNGNKRTALVSSLILLERNNYDLVNTSEDELFDMATSVVAHNFPLPENVERTDDAEVQALSSWFRNRMTSKQSGDVPLEFRKLRAILESHGCTFDAPNQNHIKIRRGGFSVKTGYPRENFTVSVSEVKRIGQCLRLDEIGSRDFYDIDNAVDQFVIYYRDLLWRLADA